MLLGRAAHPARKYLSALALYKVKVILICYLKILKELYWMFYQKTTNLYFEMIL
jgi:hypothetical protein